MENKQGSIGWINDRLGKVTASKIADMMASSKTGESAGRANYRMQLVCERLTGLKEETYTNASMATGNEREPLARNAYELLNGVLVHQVAFIDHPTIKMSGASPDGVVGDGLIEIKCPQQNTHGNTLKDQKIPTKYQYQMNWQMACTGALWNDFVSYNPTFPEHLQLCIIRLHRDDVIIKNLENAVIAFLDEVEAEVKTFNKLKGN